LKYLLELVNEIASLANSTEGIGPEWPVPTATLVSIYRNEDAKKASADSYVPEEVTPGPLIRDQDGD
jgi:hypothetical protein